MTDMTTPMTEPLLVFTTEEGLICPYFRCANCGEKVTESRGAMAIFEPDENWQYTGRLMVVHKTCFGTGPLEEERLPWRELDVLLGQLVFNSKATGCLRAGKEQVR
jgi:hypothetical protein